MKKIIAFFLMTIILASLVAYAGPPEYEEIHFLEFSSIEDIYPKLQALTDDEWRRIQLAEDMLKDFRAENTHMGEAELEYGVIGNFFNAIFESGTLIMPHYQGSTIQLRSHLQFTLSNPSVDFFIGFEQRRENIISTTYFDPNLQGEANEKGASWLLSVIRPNSLNVHNYKERHQAEIERLRNISYDYSEIDGEIVRLPEEYTARMEIWREQRIRDLQNSSVYEKKYSIGGREVRALVDFQAREGREPFVEVHFVYDNILARVSGEPRSVEAMLLNLSFQEVAFAEPNPAARWQNPFALWRNSLPNLQPPFTDLSPDAWYFEAITFMHQQGIMNGHADGRIGAEETLTRAQFATLLWVIENRPEPSNSSYYSFTDVQPEHWHYNAVTWAAGNGIVSGVGDRLFSPDAPVSRQQVLQMLYNYAANFKGIEIPQVQGLPDFSDLDEVDTWAENAAMTLAKAGVMNGFPDEGLLKPRADTTRGEAAWMLMNFIKIIA